MGAIGRAPLPLGPHIRNGYLLTAGSWAELAAKIGVDSHALQDTINRFNAHAARGEDPDFGKGTDAYHRFNGDPHAPGPNPCLAPLEQGPFYAMKMVPGDIGTFLGLRVDGHARVLDAAGTPIRRPLCRRKRHDQRHGRYLSGAGITIGPALTFGYIAASARGRRSRPLGPSKQRKPSSMSLITPVILVGGSGKRLWPLSRESMPKQFVPLLGKQSTFQQTLLRVADRGLFGKPVIATNDAYRFMCEGQAREIGIEIDILVEPSRRDSGPAMAAAAAYTRGLGAKAVLALASDHLVIGAEEFLAGCREGLAAVEKGGIVTFGIPPTEPKTDYGYIRPGTETDRPGDEGRGLRREAQCPEGDAATSPRACCGTAATSCSRPTCCCRRWRASSRRWPPPPRKPWPRPRRPARRCSSTPTPSARRRPSRSTMP